MDYFLSDLHFGHGNIIKYSNRPFASVEEMDKVLIDNINALVKPNDTIWFLGDFCFGPREPDRFYETALGYRSKINCNNIIIVRGNHDPDPTSHRADERHKASRFYSLFKKDYSLLNMTLGNQRVTLCHYAMARWNKSHHGSVHLYGHSHSDIEDWMDRMMPGRRSMDVGVDNIAKLFGEYRPISFAEVMGIMNKRPGFLEHHNR